MNRNVVFMIKFHGGKKFGQIVVNHGINFKEGILHVMPVYQYNSKVTSESHDILANYIASSVQWHKCYGILRSRGNTKKPKAPEDMLAKSGIHDSSGIIDSEVIPRNLELLKI